MHRISIESDAFFFAVSILLQNFLFVKFLYSILFVNLLQQNKYLDFHTITYHKINAGAYP